MTMMLQGKRQSGFSLVEIMVGLVMALLATVVIMQVFAVSEGYKRTTTSGADAQENGLIALHAIETDVRMAGYGIVTNGSMICTAINTYFNGTPKTNQSMAPLTITDGGTGLPDSIDVLYSTSAFGSAPTRIVKDMPNSSAILTVNNGKGFKACDILLLATPGTADPCSQVQMTQDAQPTGNGDNLAHNSGLSLYNPPGGDNIFPTAGYTVSPQSIVINMGTFINHRYQVASNNLRVTDLNGADNATGCAAAANPTPNLDVVSNIVNIQAQYGVATAAGGQAVNCWTSATASGSCTVSSSSNWTTSATHSLSTAQVKSIKAVRLAIVARSTLMEKPPASGTCDTTTAAPISWQGGPAIDLSADSSWKCYRYKVYQTIIPIRNVIWANI